jgi:hypothetical protein
MPALCKALMSLKTGDGWIAPGSELLLDTDEARRLQAAKVVVIVEEDEPAPAPAPAVEGAAKPTRKKGGSSAAA